MIVVVIWCFLNVLIKNLNSFDAVGPRPLTPICIFVLNLSYNFPKISSLPHRYCPVALQSPELEPLKSAWVSSAHAKIFQSVRITFRSSLVFLASKFSVSLCDWVGA